MEPTGGYYVYAANGKYASNPSKIYVLNSFSKNTYTEVCTPSSAFSGQLAGIAYIGGELAEDGIHDIGEMAFYELPNLTSINLENVDFIREGAFYGCSSMENVSLMDGVVIGDGAFSKTPNASLNP